MRRSRGVRSAGKRAESSCSCNARSPLCLIFTEVIVTYRATRCNRPRRKGSSDASSPRPITPIPSLLGYRSPPEYTTKERSIARYQPCKYGILCQIYKDIYPNPDIETFILILSDIAYILILSVLAYILILSVLAYIMTLSDIAYI